nr:MAG TPA: hypothetical protein [Caudoviricetes sp.]
MAPVNRSEEKSHERRSLPCHCSTGRGRKARV